MIKMTMYFATDNYTWTESYYSDGAMPTPPWTNLKFVAKYRAQMLGDGATIEAIRLIDTAKPRQAIYPDLSAGFVTLSTTTPQQPDTQWADRPYSSVLVQFFSVNGYTKRTYFSGAPDLLIGQQPLERRGIEGNLVETWSKSLDKLTGALALGGWGWLRQAWPNQPALITAVIPPAAPLNLIAIQTAAAIVFTFKKKLTIRGFRRNNTRQPGLNGTYDVSLDPSYFPPPNQGPFRYALLGTGANLVQPTNFSGVGQVNPDTPTLTLFQENTAPEVNGYSILSATHRKRGATALAPRGRSRTRG